ncbi:hypothetical protein [Flavobacterium sp.]|uniref:hypothetical protein n=1 Tax=Flavobacterium sp. TaxID=239 RepID=UPI003F6A05AD
MLFSCSDNELTEVDYKVYAEEIVVNIKRKEVKKLQDKFDINFILDDIKKTSDTLGVANQYKLRKTYVVNQLFEVYAPYLKNIIDLVTKESETKLLKLFKEKNKYHALIMIKNNDNFEITDFILEQRNNKVFITNYISTVTSFNLNVHFNWAIQNQLMNVPEYFNAQKYLVASNNLYERKEYKEAYEVFNQIPEYFQNFPNFYILKVKITREMNDEQLFANTLENWISLNYDNKCFRYLKASELYYYVNDKEKSLKYLDSLENFIGKNSVINDIKKSRFN